MNEIKKKFQIVVARYNENLDWLLPFKDISVIYNKGNNDITLNRFNSINLPNFGRESHTYLYHIITNYDSLADKTIFFQGKINDHRILSMEEYFNNDEFTGKIDKLDINIFKRKITHENKWKVEYDTGNMRRSMHTPFEWLKDIISLDFNENENIKIVWGANFAVNKNIILKKPKSFYEDLIRLLDFHVNPEEGHFFERSWYTIFHNNFISKKKIGYYQLKNHIDFDIITKIIDKDEYEEIHIWCPIIANYNLKNTYKINYTPNNNNYNTIFPIIINNSFTLNIKANNDIHIIVEFNEIDECYEIVLGGWGGNRSVIRNDILGKEIAILNDIILNKNNFIKFDFSFGDIITIKRNDENMMETLNIYENCTISNIKIKSCFGSDAYWEYESPYYLNDPKLKIFLLSNIYQNLNYFYSTNYLNYYTQELNFL
jgi:hypothetical protein